MPKIFENQEGLSATAALVLLAGLLAATLAGTFAVRLVAAAALVFTATAGGSGMEGVVVRIGSVAGAGAGRGGTGTPGAALTTGVLLVMASRKIWRSISVRLVAFGGRTMTGPALVAAAVAGTGAL